MPSLVSSFSSWSDTFGWLKRCTTVHRRTNSQSVLHLGPQVVLLTPLSRRFLWKTQRFRAGSHFDISISTSISISIRKIRKICVNRGYISISTSISICTRKWKKFHSLCLCLCLCLCNPGSHIAAFSLRLDLAEEVNRHFLENDYGDLSFFCCRFELSNKFRYVKEIRANSQSG